MSTELDLLKSQAEFFPKGRIVPTRVMRITNTSTGHRFKHTHQFKFASDTWMIRYKNAQILFCNPETVYMMHLAGKHSYLTLTGNPYGYHGNLMVFGKDERYTFELVIAQMAKVEGETNEQQ